MIQQESEIPNWCWLKEVRSVREGLPVLSFSGCIQHRCPPANSAQVPPAILEGSGRNSFLFSLDGPELGQLFSETHKELGFCSLKLKTESGLEKPLAVLCSLRNKDFQEVTLERDGQVLLHFALAYGFRNIQNLVQKLKRGKCPYHYVEVMACPSGEAAPDPAWGSSRAFQTGEKGDFSPPWAVTATPAQLGGDFPVIPQDLKNCS